MMSYMCLASIGRAVQSSLTSVKGGERHGIRSAHHRGCREDPRKLCEDRACVQVRHLCVQVRMQVQPQAHEVALVESFLVRLREGEVLTSPSLPLNKGVAHQQMKEVLP